MMKKKNVLSLILLAGMLFTQASCGTKNVEVPELIPSLVYADNVRPVSYGVVGDVENYIGHVVPMEYCHFWEKGSGISEITVNIGDYVKKGDVLARADIDYLNDEINAIKSDRARETELFAISEQEYQYNHYILEYESTKAWYTGDTKAVEEISKEIEILEENHRFDVLLHEFMLEDFDKQVKELKKSIEEGTLVSEAEGYVVYRKDIVSSSNVGGDENVVIIADYNDTYIELEEIVTIRRGSEADKVRDPYVSINGEWYHLEEYAYSASELAVIESREMYPPVRYRMEDADKMPAVGTDVVVSVRVDAASNVLVVGNDSIHEDDAGYYVYVIGDDGEKELRRVYLGKQDNVYAEVTAGLSEGELVVYSAMALTDYDTMQVFRTTYAEEHTISELRPAEMPAYQYNSDYFGTIASIEAESGAEVKKGDLVFTLKTDSGNARILELKENREAVIKQRDLDIKNADKLIEEINKSKETNQALMMSDLRTLSLTFVPADDEEQKQFDESVAGIKTVYGLSDKALDASIELAKLSKEKTEINCRYDLAKAEAELKKATKNNNGKGIVNVYAGADGKIIYEGVSSEQAINAGDPLFKIVQKSDEMMEFFYIGNVPLGSSVSFDDENGNTICRGTVTGFGKNEKVYISEKEGYTYLTHCMSGNLSYLSYVTVEDASVETASTATQVSFNSPGIDNMIVISDRYIFFEKKNRDTVFYVWKLIDGRPVKQYIEFSRVKNPYVTDKYVMYGIEDGDIIMYVPEVNAIVGELDTGEDEGIKTGERREYVKVYKTEN